MHAHSGSDGGQDALLAITVDSETIGLARRVVADALRSFGVTRGWRGRGVGIMRALMDHVEFVPEPESGMTVHLVKTLSVEPHGLLARLRAANRPLDPQ